MATYPSGIYSYTNRSGTDTLSVGTHSTIHNEASAEVIAIETELGTNPKGSYPNVAGRLDGLAALIGAQHTQNTDVGTSSATFYLGGSSGPKIKENSGVIEVRNNGDTLYADFTCATITCSNINGLSAAQLAALQTNTHTHANKALLDTYTQTEVNLADAVSKRHTQNTDTGSTSETFQLNNVNPLSAKIKVDDLDPTILEVRNGADSAYAYIRSAGFLGQLVADNSDVNKPAIQYNEGTNTWQLANDGVSFVDIGTGLAMAGSQGAVQFNNTTNLGADPAFYYDTGTDTLYATNINVSGIIAGPGGINIAGTSSDTFEINTDGNGLTIDCSGLANDRSVTGEQLYQAAQNYHVAATAGTGISVVGQQVSNTDTGSAAVTAHNLAYTHTDIALNTADRHVAATAGTGINVVGQQISNTDTGSAAVTAHNLAYVHTDIALNTAARHTQNTDTGTSQNTFNVGDGLDSTKTITAYNADANKPALRYNSGTNIWEYSNDGTTWQDMGSGGGGNVTHDVNQTTHGFAVGDVIRHNGTIYIKAQADSDTNAEVYGIVSAVAGPDDFTVQMAGRVTGLSGLTAGTVYFLSGATAGALTATEPTTVGYISKPVILADTTTSGFFYNFRGFEIAAATSYSLSFTNASLSAGILTVNHSLGIDYPSIVIYDNNKKVIIPDEITSVTTNQVTVDLSSYGTLTGTWNLRALPEGSSGTSYVNTTTDQSVGGVKTFTSHPIFPATSNPANLLYNADFENWSAGTSVAPDGWTGGTVGGGSTSRSSTAYSGSYSLQILSVAGVGNYTIASQYVHAERGIAYWQGRTVTAGCWIYLVSGTSASLIINDGVGESTSSVTSTGSWQFVSVSRTINGSATQMGIKLYGGSSGVVAYFDCVSLVEGTTPYAFSPKTPDEDVWADYSTTSTKVGWSSFTNLIIYVKRIGKVGYCNFVINGTSNSTTASFTVPWTSNTNTYPSVAIISAQDNTGTPVPGTIGIAASSNVATCRRDLTGNVFTASGTKQIAGQFFWAIA